MEDSRGGRMTTKAKKIAENVAAASWRSNLLKVQPQKSNLSAAESVGG
jgi:hypothetical protein